MNKLRKAELITIAICVVAIVLRLFKLQLSVPAIIISFSALMILQIIQIFISAKKWKSSKSVALINITFYVFLIFLISASQFLILFWTGGDTIVYQSLKIYLYISLAGIIYSLFKNKEYRINLWANVKPAFTRFSIALIIGVILSILPDETRINLFAINPDLTRERLLERKQNYATELQKQNDLNRCVKKAMERRNMSKEQATKFCDCYMLYLDSKYTDKQFASSSDSIANVEKDKAKDCLQNAMK